jgi:hypothetical protein
VIEAGILAAFAIFFAASDFTTASGKKTDPIDILTERIEFRLERLETVLAEMQKAWETMNDTMLRLSDDIIKHEIRLARQHPRIRQRIPGRCVTQVFTKHESDSGKSIHHTVSG